MEDTQPSSTLDLAMSPTQLADVIALVVGNSPDLSSPRDLCSLLLVDTNCRQSLQRREVWGHMRVTQSAHSSRDLQRDRADGVSRLSVLTSFAHWLPKHAELVSCLEVQLYARFPMFEPYACWSCSSQWLLVQQLMAQALQSCRFSAGANSTALQPLRLRQCVIHGPLQNPLLLEELGAAGLQELDLKGLASSACLSALARMTSLKSLTLQVSTSDDGASAGYAQVHHVVAQLTQLTSLKAWFRQQHEGAAAQLPPSLQHLHMLCRYAHQSSAGGSTEGTLTTSCSELDLQHLTALKTLTLWQWCAASLHLPPALSRMELQQSTVLQVTGGVGLLDACLKSSMQDVISGDMSTLAAISKLPHIQKLKTCFVDMEAVPTQAVAAQQAAAALSLATSLTSLCLGGHTNCSCGVHWCQPLSRLPQLQQLELEWSDLQRDDLLHLSSLTSLTRLRVSCNALDDSVASALAVKLTKLLSLDLQSDNLTTDTLLPVVGAALTGLVDLRLLGSGSLQPYDSNRCCHIA